jgi:hypothetical protein
MHAVEICRRRQMRSDRQEIAAQFNEEKLVSAGSTPEISFIIFYRCRIYCCNVHNRAPLNSKEGLESLWKHLRNGRAIRGFDRLVVLSRTSALRFNRSRHNSIKEMHSRLPTRDQQPTSSYRAKHPSAASSKARQRQH